MNDKFIQLNIDNAEKVPQTIYMDGDIVLWDNIRDIPSEHNTLKVNLFLIIGCSEGKMSISVNSQRYTVHANEFLLCMPNTVLDDCMMSADFNGKAICLSTKVLLEGMHMVDELWDKAFWIKENPIVHIDKVGMEIFYAYNALATLRNNACRRAYGKEVMNALMRAMLYEILAELSGYVNSPKVQLPQQKELLFKRFIELLSSLEVKPRSVSWYAGKLFITPKYLSTICKAVSGKTAFEWINEYMMMDIRYQLKYSSKSIKEVVDSLGFPNISFFGKYVKAHSGFNPTEYRRMLREKRDDELTYFCHR